MIFVFWNCKCDVNTYFEDVLDDRTTYLLTWFKVKQLSVYPNRNHVTTHPEYKHLFSRRVENSVNTDPMASPEASYASSIVI